MEVNLEKKRTKVKPDFFISYADEDVQWAEWLSWTLEDAGYRVILQSWDFVPGSNFVLEMDKATSQSERTIALLSPAYVSSHYVQPEWAAAFSKDPIGSTRKLVPVRVEECVLDGLLSQIVYVDLVGLTEDEARNKLLSALAEDRMKLEIQPEFPGTPGGADEERPSFPAHEEGFLDLVEQGVCALDQGNTAATAFAEEVFKLADSARLHTQRVRGAAAQSGHNLATRYKQIARSAARDMISFSKQGEIELRAMSAQYETGFGAWMAALDMLPQFGSVDTEILNENLSSIEGILDSIPAARNGVEDLRNVVAGLPPVERSFAFARRRASLVLDAGMRVLDRAEYLASETLQTAQRVLSEVEQKSELQD